MKSPRSVCFLNFIRIDNKRQGGKILRNREQAAKYKKMFVFNDLCSIFLISRSRKDLQGFQRLKSSDTTTNIFWTLSASSLGMARSWAAYQSMPSVHRVRPFIVVIDMCSIHEDLIKLAALLALVLAANVYVSSFAIAQALS